MRAATMFSGIGAPEQAMPDWRWLWHAEIEPFPSAVMAARHPGSINLGDVSAPDFVERAEHVGRPDVLVFGSPCQSFSVAGKRLGLDDPRGNLALVALGVVERLRPAWFVFENVPGLLSLDRGRAFGTFLGLVGQLGYGFAYRVLDAQYFGVPQRRRRVFVVGCLGDWRRAAAVLFEPASLSGHPAPRREAGEGAAKCLTRGSGGGQRYDAETETLIAHSLRGEGFDASEDGTGRGTPLVPVTFDWQAGGGGADQSFRGKSRSYITDKPGRTRALTSCKTLAVAYAFDGRQSDVIQYGDRTGQLDTDGHTIAVAFQPNDPGNHVGAIAPSLRAGGGGGSFGSRAVVAFSCKDHGADAGALAPTLRAMGHSGSHANAGGQVALMQAQQVRRLTPRECERLQGFPDGHTAILYRGRPAADGPRYKALGNSMAVPVLRWILGRVEAQAAASREAAA